MSINTRKIYINVILLLNLIQTWGQLINRAPHFVPGIGDMSKFSLKENTPVGTPVYQLKGMYTFLRSS